MLDDRDERALAALEPDLARDDPALRSRLERRPSATWWPVAAAIVGLVVAIALTALGLAGNAFLLLLVVATPLALRTWRRGQVPRPARRRRAG